MKTFERINDDGEVVKKCITRYFQIKKYYKMNLKLFTNDMANGPSTSYDPRPHSYL